MIDVIGNGGVLRYSNKRYILKPETVAEHCWSMVELAIKLRSKMEFDLKDVVYRIMLHDIDEGVTLDIPRDLKYYNESYKNLTNEITLQLLIDKGLVINDDILNDIKQSKDHSTVEGAITHLLDVYQAYLKLGDEVNLLGNKSLEYEYANECNEYLIKVVKSLCEEYPLFKNVWDEFLPIN